VYTRAHAYTHTQHEAYVYGMRSKPVQKETAGDIITEKYRYNVS